MKMAFALAMGMLAMASAAWGDTPIYKWVDAQGVVHYSTVPHSDDAKQLSIVNTGTLPNASTAPAAATATTAASSPATDLSLVTPTQTDSTACKAGRDRLLKYLQADHLYVQDDKGQKKQLSKDDQNQALNEARDYVRQACSPGAQ
jgi:hypothetical protein